MAMERNRANSGSLFLPQPSTIFAGIETQERLIWDIKPNNSFFGKLSVTLYISNVKEWLFCQTVSFLKSCILLSF